MSSMAVPKIPRRLQRWAWVCVCMAAVLLAYVFILQTHLRYRDLNATEQDEHLMAADRPPKFSFVIKLLTYNRLRSFMRCIDSLAAADYGTHVVKLHVLIDHFPLSNVSSSSETVKRKLKEAHDLLNYVDQFVWIHGPKEIHYRTQNAGLQGQWLEAWWPASDNEFAFMVEDDMRLSPLFFKYLTRIIDTYYYNPSNYNPSVYGASLQRPRFVPGKHGNPLQVEDTSRLFLYQLVGTWGQLLFPKPWKEFRLWYDIQKSMNSEPLLDGMVTSGWYRRSRERIWTPWFIKFAYQKGYFNLYTHFPNEQALSVSYRDKGVNTKKEAGPDSNLIGNASFLGVNFWEMKPWKHLKRYDYCFHEVKQGTLIKSTKEVHTIVPLVQANGTVLLVNAMGFPENIIRNWLCQFSKLSMKNYVILMQNEKLETELLHRGHAVMHVEAGLGGGKLVSSDSGSIDSFLSVAQAITWALQSDCSVWMTNVDTLWASNPLPRIRVAKADMLGFSHGVGISTELMYIKHSKMTLSLWKRVHKDVWHHAESGNFKFTPDFVFALVGRLVSDSALNFQALPPNIKAEIFTVRKEALGSPVALLTGIRSNDTYVRVLRSLGLWMLDSELSCTGVYC